MILVPTNTPGYKIVDDTHVLGISGNHCEVVYDNVRVPKESVLGPRGHGFLIGM
jgi:acyl-CoA dehydrogenase